MKSPSEQPRIPLRIQAADPEAEIAVVGGSFDLLAKGQGDLQTDLGPGLYKVKLRVGNATREVFVSLKPVGDLKPRGTLFDPRPGESLVVKDEQLTLTFPRLPFLTAVPLPDTDRTTDEHKDGAVEHSRKVHLALGSGSQIFVFIRDALGPIIDPESHHLAAHLSLHDLAGRLLVDFTDAPAAVAADGSFAACNIELDPGTYRLRLQAPESGILEGVIEAREGWQTQVFTLVRGGAGGGTGPERRTFDFACLSGLLSPMGQGFLPELETVRSTELMRLALAEGRRSMTRELLEGADWVRARNPMFGLLAGHLLLLNAAPDLDLLNDVVVKLRQLLGAHRDVEALALALREPAPPDLVYQAPPMLLSGWTQVVERSIAAPALVPGGSLASRATERLWGGGPWVVWHTPGPDPVDDLPPTVELLAALAPELRTTWDAVVPYRSAEPPPLRPERLAVLVRDLCMPVSTIEDAWASLWRDQQDRGRGFG